VVRARMQEQRALGQGVGVESVPTLRTLRPSFRRLGCAPFKNQAVERDFVAWYQAKLHSLWVVAGLCAIGIWSSLRHHQAEQQQTHSMDFTLLLVVTSFAIGHPLHRPSILSRLPMGPTFCQATIAGLVYVIGASFYAGADALSCEARESHERRQRFPRMVTSAWASLGLGMGMQSVHERQLVKYVALLHVVRAVQLSIFAEEAPLAYVHLLAETWWAGLTIGFCLAIPAEYLARQLWLELNQLRHDNSELTTQVHAIETVRRDELLRRARAKEIARRSQLGHMRSGLASKVQTELPSLHEEDVGLRPADLGDAADDAAAPTEEEDKATPPYVAADAAPSVTAADAYAPALLD